MTRARINRARRRYNAARRHLNRFYKDVGLEPVCERWSPRRVRVAVWGLKNKHNEPPSSFS